MGPESPKMLHKLILPENVVISYFSDVEMPLKCPEVELRGQKSQNFGLKSCIKFGKVLQTSQFLVKICFFISPSLLFTQNTHTYFYFLYIVDFMSKNGNFYDFSVFLPVFSEVRGRKNIFREKMVEIYSDNVFVHRKYH